MAEGGGGKYKEVPVTAKLFHPPFDTQYRNVTIMLCKKLCDDFLAAARRIFAVSGNICKSYQISRMMMMMIY
jgi:hypothetical protein